MVVRNNICEFILAHLLFSFKYPSYFPFVSSDPPVPDKKMTIKQINCKQTNYLQILSAQDKELNKWVSLKKLLRYQRDEKEELRDKKVYQHRSSLPHVKQKILPSLFVE